MILSPSNLELAFRCSFWARPENKQPWKDAGEKALHGRKVHKVLEQAITNRDITSDLPEFREFSPNAWLAFAGVPVGAIAEQKFRMDLKTKRFERIPAQAKCSFEEIGGTIDVHWWDGQKGHVVDWKTGYAHLPKPGNSPQLLFYSAAIAKVYDLDEVQASYVLVNDEDPYSTTATVDIFQLEDFIEQMIEVIYGVSKSVPVPGLHCQGLWCPFASKCPAHLETVRAIVREDPKPFLVPSPDRIESPEHATSIYHRMMGARRILAEVEECLRQYSTKVPIPLGDGSTYGPRQYTKEEIIAPSIEALQAVLPSVDISGACSFSVGKGALEKIVKAGAQRGKKTDAWDEAMRAVRGAGLTEVKQEIHYREGKRPTIAQEFENESLQKVHPKALTIIGDGYDDRDPTNPDAF